MRGARAFGKAASARFDATNTQVQHHSTSTMFANKGQVSVCSDTKSTTLTSRHRLLSVNPVRGGPLSCYRGGPPQVWEGHMSTVRAKPEGTGVLFAKKRLR